MKKKYKILIILAAVLAVIIIACATIGIYNEKVMDRTVNEGLAALEQHFDVTEVSAEPYDSIRLFGLIRCEISHYEVSGLGNLCVMKMHAGVMQMATFVLSPYEKNMPLLSMDFEYILCQRKERVEFYDLVSDKEDAQYREVMSDIQSVLDAYSDLPDFEHKETAHDALFGACAFRSGNISEDARIRQYFAGMVSAYAADAAKLPVLTEEQQTEKRELTQQFCTVLIDEGGAAAKLFVSTIGEEATTDFFEKVFFGTVK